ncbi:hypothetical protein SAMN05421866_2904 [Chryseobacterium oranimense]|uniref:Uncharacterized protein n=1 Tax=Chryseobacterium oranimense TaxID=421058 RepID=A0A1M5TAU4_9FLAO|nr:hypothetical protein [Chryseobacterium oranimense]SHH47905.1 hypothetical protein SAMN05421866_2904 [Chryseobacterium oranimense]
MSYPVLKANQSYSNVEVRESANTGLSYDQMTVIFRGAVDQGQEFYGSEGGKLCVKCSNWAGDLTHQPAFCASGYNGISVGQAEITTF